MADSKRTPDHYDRHGFENYQLKLNRKLLHISSSWMGFTYMYMLRAPEFAPVLTVIFTAFLIVFDFARNKFSIINRLEQGVLRSLFIDRDSNGLNSATWYMISILLLVFLFGGQRYEQRLAVGIPILYLAFGDTAASVAGKLLNGKRFLFFRGSWQGMAACFLVCLVTGLFFLNPAIAVVTAAAATTAEAMPLKCCDDNLTMALTSGLLIHLLVV